MAKPITNPNLFAGATTGTTVQLDADFATVYAAVNDFNTMSNYLVDSGAANAYVVTLPANLTLSLAAGLMIQFKATNANTGASTLNANVTGVKNILNLNGTTLSAGQIALNAIVQVIYDGTQYLLMTQSLQTAIPRSYLAGLTMSPAGASASMPIAAGQASDSTNVSMMSIAAITKTTSAWAVGSGNGGLDTGSIATNTWYKFYLIQRLDTGVVDAIFTIAALATGPALPTNYTLFRYIGSAKTDGASQWIKFTQDGDYFVWAATILDVNTNNPGTSAITSTLTVPTGVNVFAILNVVLVAVGSTNSWLLNISDLSANNEVTSLTAAPLGIIATIGSAAETTEGATYMLARTNTSAQIRYRLSASDAATTARIATIGWIDHRQRNA